MITVERSNVRTVREYTVVTETLEDDDLFEIACMMLQNCKPDTIREAIDAAFKADGVCKPSWLKEPTW